MIAIPPRTRVLLAINAAIAAVAAAVAFYPAHPAERLARLVTREPLPVLPAASPPGVVANLAPLRTSPMFYRSRTTVVVEDPAILAASRPNFVLTAAMILPKGKSIAYLRPPSGTSAIRVTLGDDLSGWTITAIEAQRVLATRKSQSVEIVPAARTASPGLIRVAAAPPAAGTPRVRTLGATGVPVAATNALVREPRLYRPPPSH